MRDDQARALRSLPSVSAVLRAPELSASIGSLSLEVATRVIRDAVDAARTEILDGQYVAAAQLRSRIVETIGKLTGESPKRVINGTGVIIQTNLGRAPVSAETGAAMREVAEGYVALETELTSGDRGGRGRTIEVQMRALTGAERTLVVNNNAAAVYLMLAALCQGRDVLVSRGEAVEIGGGFRIPDVLRQSGANLIEVGTTNRTYVADYANAITEKTAAILKVHASNFAMIGFTSSPATIELAALAKERGVLLLEDAGSGCLLDTARYGLTHEPTIGESLLAGVDVVCASGDKLLGGPQAGLILGRGDLVGKVAAHPMARALRADKTCLAGTSATLRHYIAGEAVEAVPVWWSISRDMDWLQERCAEWVAALGGRVDVVATEAVIGGGSLPGAILPSCGITVRSAEASNVLARKLRTASSAVMPRIVDNRVVVDARTVLPGEDAALVDAVAEALDAS